MYKKLVFPPIKRWDEGLPLGNGIIGALVYGEKETIISLDKNDLWDLTPAPETKEKGFNYPNLVNLVKEGTEASFAESCRLFDKCYDHLTPTKIKAGRLHVGLALDSESSFALDYEYGLAQITSGFTMISLILSHELRVGTISSNKPLAISFEAPSVLFDSLHGLGYPPPIRKKEGPFELIEVNSNNGFCFAFISLHTKLDYFFDIVSARDGQDGIKQAEARLLEASKEGFASIQRKEKEWWGRFNEESSVSLPDDSFQREYDLSNYFLGSGFGLSSDPLPLQGLWTSDDDALPPWKGDYHNDLNVQMTYSSALIANHMAAFKPLLDFMWRNKKTYESVASSFYEVPGLLVPGVSDYLGRPLGGWPMYSLSPTMSIWAVKAFDDYYRATNDFSFLRERAYPMLHETGEAIMGLLKKENGFYLLPLSSSPEIHDNTLRSYLSPISNNDIALLRYLFKTLISYSNILGFDSKEYEERLEGLPFYYHGKDGSFLLDEKEGLEESHRHFSHLLSVFPLEEINAETKGNCKDIKASLSNIEKLGTSLWAGFSFVWEASIAARVNESQLAYRRLYEFLDGFIGPNGFHLNGDFKDKGYSSLKYRPFTLEANFGYCRAITDLLFQERNGDVYLFPALPPCWQETSFRSLRGCGSLLFTSSIKDGVISQLEIVSEVDKEITIHGPFGKGKRDITIGLKAGENHII